MSKISSIIVQAKKKKTTTDLGVSLSKTSIFWLETDLVEHLTANRACLDNDVGGPNWARKEMMRKKIAL